MGMKNLTEQEVGQLGVDAALLLASPLPGRKILRKDQAGLEGMAGGG